MPKKLNPWPADSNGVCGVGSVCMWAAGGSAKHVCGVWAADGWLAVTMQWVQARDDDDARDGLTWTLPSFLPCSLFSSTPTHAPAANLPRGRGAE